MDGMNKPATKRASHRPLREVEVNCPAWSPEPVRIRELSVREFLAARHMTDDQERLLHFAGCMVLGADGEPVGLDAIMSAPMAALGELSLHIERVISGKKETDADPLT